ncbi:penicillin-binding protein activator [Nitratireductor luteus]|uniref:penicillin-binding protein activator n=1 Tax=Nitratireductor luteus TaxID=2976980 RepID=UPI00223F55B9|nr:penicillin-binding protein activator [Nitratireductor luteus]
MTQTNTTRAGLGRACGIFMLIAGLAACAQQQVGRGLPAVTPAPDAPAAARPSGEVFGNGDIRVALLLPLSAGERGGAVAAEIRNAALLALEDRGSSSLQLVVKDTAGTPEGATAAAASAAGEDTALVLGPVFAANVRAAADVLRPRGTTMIAFSSDSSVAGPGVFLNSHQPEGLVDRVISHAASQGMSRVVAIVPNDAGGALAESQARQTLQRTGGSLTAVARYDFDTASVLRAAQEVALAVQEADAILLPDGGNAPAAIAASLSGMGVDLSGKRLLGTGQWASADLSSPALQGGWYADVEHERMNRFKERYRARYGTEPSLTAALGYDTVTLAIALGQRGGAEAFAPANLTRASGYAGYGGIFRFRPDGTAERGYAVYEIREGQPVLISPAPASLAGQS